MMWLERAGYEASRADLEAERFDAAEKMVAKVEAAGAKSARLENLKLLAERKIPGETVLAMNGNMLDRGFLATGRQPARPTLAPNEKLAAARLAAVEKYPTDARVLLNAADSYLAEREFEKADALFQRAADADPKDFRGPLGRGLVAAARGDVDTALGFFRQSETLAPDALPVLVNVAVCLQAKARKSDVEADRVAAAKAWERVLPKLPEPQRQQVLKQLDRQ